MTKPKQPVWIAQDDRRWNHIRIDVSVLTDQRLDAYHLSAYLALVVHAETGTGLTERSIDTLCTDARAGDRALRYRLKDLEAWGYVEVVRTFGKASTFRLLPAPTAAPHAVGAAPHAGGVGTDPGTDPGMKRRDTKEEQEELKDRPLVPKGREKFNPITPIDTTPLDEAKARLRSIKAETLRKPEKTTEQTA